MGAQVNDDGLFEMAAHRLGRCSRPGWIDDNGNRGGMGAGGFVLESIRNICNCGVPHDFWTSWIWPVAPVDGSLDVVEQVSDSIEHAWELFSM